MVVFISTLSLLIGLYFFFTAKSAIHEAEGLICFLISAVLASSVHITNTIKGYALKLGIDNKKIEKNTEDRLLSLIKSVRKRLNPNS